MLIVSLHCLLWAFRMPCSNCRAYRVLKTTTEQGTHPHYPFYMRAVPFSSSDFSADLGLGRKSGTLGFCGRAPSISRALGAVFQFLRFSLIPGTPNARPLLKL